MDAVIAGILKQVDSEWGRNGKTLGTAGDETKADAESFPNYYFEPFKAADGNPFKAHIDAARFPIIHAHRAEPDTLYAGLGLTSPGGNVANLTNDRLHAEWTSALASVVFIPMSSGSGKTRAGLELAIRVHTLFMVCGGTVGGNDVGCSDVHSAIAWARRAGEPSERSRRLHCGMLACVLARLMCLKQLSGDTVISPKDFLILQLRSTELALISQVLRGLRVTVLALRIMTLLETLKPLGIRNRMPLFLDDCQALLSLSDFESLGIFPPTESGTKPVSAFTVATSALREHGLFQLFLSGTDLRLSDVFEELSGNGSKQSYPARSVTDLSTPIVSAMCLRSFFRKLQMADIANADDEIWAYAAQELRGRPRYAARLLDVVCRLGHSSFVTGTSTSLRAAVDCTVNILLHGTVTSTGIVNELLKVYQTMKCHGVRRTQGRHDVASAFTKAWQKFAVRGAFTSDGNSRIWKARWDKRLDCNHPRVRAFADLVAAGLCVHVRTDYNIAHVEVSEPIMRQAMLDVCWQCNDIEDCVWQSMESIAWVSQSMNGFMCELVACVTLDSILSNHDVKDIPGLMDTPFGKAFPGRLQLPHKRRFGRQYFLADHLLDAQPTRWCRPEENDGPDLAALAVATASAATASGAEPVVGAGASSTCGASAGAGAGAGAGKTNVDLSATPGLRRVAVVVQVKFAATVQEQHAIGTVTRGLMGSGADKTRRRTLIADACQETVVLPVVLSAVKSLRTRSGANRSGESRGADSLWIIDPTLFKCSGCPAWFISAFKPQRMKRLHELAYPDDKVVELALRNHTVRVPLLELLWSAY